MDPYEILQIPRGSNFEEVKKAYMTAAKECHPDKGGDARLFRLLDQAYRLILAKEKNSSNNMVKSATSKASKNSQPHGPYKEKRLYRTIGDLERENNEINQEIRMNKPTMGVQGGRFDQRSFNEAFQSQGHLGTSFGYEGMSPTSTGRIPYSELSEKKKTDDLYQKINEYRSQGQQLIQGRTIQGEFPLQREQRELPLQRELPVQEQSYDNIVPNEPIEEIVVQPNYQIVPYDDTRAYTEPMKEEVLPPRHRLRNGTLKSHQKMKIANPQYQSLKDHLRTELTAQTIQPMQSIQSQQINEFQQWQSEQGGPTLGGPTLGGPTLGGPTLGGPTLGGYQSQYPQYQQYQQPTTQFYQPMQQMQGMFSIDQFNQTQQIQQMQSMQQLQQMQHMQQIQQMQQEQLRQMQLTQMQLNQLRENGLSSVDDSYDQGYDGQDQENIEIHGETETENYPENEQDDLQPLDNPEHLNDNRSNRVAGAGAGAGAGFIMNRYDLRGRTNEVIEAEDDQLIEKVVTSAIKQNRYSLEPEETDEEKEVMTQKILKLEQKCQVQDRLIQKMMAKLQT